MSIQFSLNGNSVDLDIDPQTSLLEALRNDVELNGAKFGCGLAQCGACAVMINGTSIRSCVTPIASVQGQQVTTLEGLGDEGNPHPLQTAFIENQAMQCGYCASGIIVSAAAFLNTNPAPSTSQIKTALAGHLCRCGAQPRMVKAVADAALVLSYDGSGENS